MAGAASRSWCAAWCRRRSWPTNLRERRALFVRGAITLQRGSAIAGVACGLPIVGYRVGGSGNALDEAGDRVVAVARPSLIRGLVRVLSDPARWTELHERSLQAQRDHFSWTRIAEQFDAALSE